MGFRKSARSARKRVYSSENRDSGESIKSYTLQLVANVFHLAREEVLVREERNTLHTLKDLKWAEALFAAADVFLSMRVFALNSRFSLSLSSCTKSLCAAAACARKTDRERENW